MYVILNNIIFEEVMFLKALSLTQPYAELIKNGVKSIENRSWKTDFVRAIKRLFNEHFEKYNVHLDFVADILGADAIKEKAKEFYDNLSEANKRQMIDYKNGDRSKSWMINRSNLKYIADNGLGG